MGRDVGMLGDGGRIGGVRSVVVVEISLEKERSDVVPVARTGAQRQLNLLTIEDLLDNKKQNRGSDENAAGAVGEGGLDRECVEVLAAKQLRGGSVGERQCLYCWLQLHGSNAPRAECQWSLAKGPAPGQTLVASIVCTARGCHPLI